MICKNLKCNKEFNERKQKIIIIKRILKGFECPYCKKKYYFIPNKPKDYIKLENGQLVRKDKKVRMSKKERLRIRKELLAGANNE